MNIQVQQVAAAPSQHGSTVAPTLCQALIGQMVGKRYRIVRHIGSGGMAHVFLAEHITLRGYVAVKVLMDHSDENTAYFCNEARLLSHLRHPNIVSVVDCGILPQGLLFIVMEWLPGENLGTYIETKGPLTPGRALWVVRQIGSALDYIHSQGVVHRDLKPENVILETSSYDAVKLFDFGVAVPFMSPPASENSKVFGTPLYMAPEQASGGLSSPATDLYALGGVALELLTGKPAYRQDSAMEAVATVLNCEPALPSHNGLHVPGLDAVIAKAMARAPEDRFASGLDFVRALSEVLRAGEPASINAELAAIPGPAPTRLQPTRVRSRAPRLDLPMLPTRPVRSSPTPLGIVAAACFAFVAWSISICDVFSLM